MVQPSNLVKADRVGFSDFYLDYRPPDFTFMKLGVNIDHVATLRQARHGTAPDPLWAAQAAQKAGADSIVCHLREDRRHIQESDLAGLKKTLRIPLNLEMSIAPAIVRIAVATKPAQATLVPERRQELTTEGGLDLRKNKKRIAFAVEKLRRSRIRVSLFIDPSLTQIREAVALGVPMVEFHTGRYAEHFGSKKESYFLNQFRDAVSNAHKRGLIIAAGHGLDYRNVTAIAHIPQIEELNIGFSIVARAMEVGFPQAVTEMVRLL